jgi:hypothetical protein
MIYLEEINTRTYGNRKESSIPPQTSVLERLLLLHDIDHEQATFTEETGFSVPDGGRHYARS